MMSNYVRENNKSIFRVCKDKNNPYVQINKTALNDARLSWQAKGLLCYMLSLPDDWKFHRAELLKHTSDGETCLRGCLSELRKYGYITIKCHKNEQNRISHWQTYVYESPEQNAHFPDVDFTHLENAPVDNAPTTNNDSTNNNFINNNKNYVHSTVREITSSLKMSKKTFPQEEAKKLFTVFWEEYPNKKGRAVAEKVFLKRFEGLNETDASNLFSDICQGLINHATEWKLTQDLRDSLEAEGYRKKIFYPSWPMGSTWISQDRWSDTYLVTPEEVRREHLR